MGSAGCTVMEMTDVPPSEPGGSTKSIGMVLWLAALVLLPATLSAGTFFGKAQPPQPTPEVRISVAGLGYQPPGTLPAFEHAAIIGVYFMDESHLLFTFDAHGLLRRDDRCDRNGFQRKVDAVVLDIPSGRVEERTQWRLYDFGNYLWDLHDGRFLLRRCSEFDWVDGSLQLHPFFQPDGALQTVGFSPDRSTMVVEQAAPGPAVRPKSALPFEYPPAHKMDVKFIRLHPLAVIARAQLPRPAIVPIVHQGILEAPAAPHHRWAINLQPFRGKERTIATVDSACRPPLTALTSTVVVAEICSNSGERAFRAFDLNGTALWQIPLPPDLHEPRFLLSANGSHFAMESLHAGWPVAPLELLSGKGIDAEIVDIYNTRTGSRIGSLRTTPIYTAGQNAAFSPDGTRIAILRDGAIEIYALTQLTPAKH